jgi:2-keto-4-pentenoate hydratase/2-oxohepta-3-ene-1,7-dioic acid hydratase in catechol pathway
MRLVSFLREGRAVLGVQVEGGTLDVGATAIAAAGVSTGIGAAATAVGVPVATDMNALISGGAEAMTTLKNFVLAADNAVVVPADELDYAPVVPAPGKIIGIGLNYRKHAEVTGQQAPVYPIVFNKYNNALTGHNTKITIPRPAERLDYEAELVIVIGKRAHKISAAAALDHVFGYTAVNDLTDRGLINRTHQWLIGKTSDGFAPLGPELITADEVADPDAIGIRCYVNGELRQDSNTNDMFFGCAELISYLSQFFPLEPGDIILTGTPEGTISCFPTDEQVYLKAGDEVTVAVEGLLPLTNTFVADV